MNFAKSFFSSYTRFTFAKIHHNASFVKDH